MKVLLASGSPRRRELLETLNIEVAVLTPEVEECPRPGEIATDYVRRNAKLKAQEVASRSDLPKDVSCLLSADTIVVHSGVILEKPKDDADAAMMLRSLSGSRHQVMTGYCIMGLGVHFGLVHFGTVTTVVSFKDLSSDEIAAYIATGEPHDKAGAYGIQGLASYMISGIEGSYSNVVGLPLCEVVAALKETIGLNIKVRTASA